MEINRLISEALEHGFTLAAPLDTTTITLMPEVRDMCAANKCNAYNTNWCCPPACGTLEECAERLKNYNCGIIVQTTGTLEDDFDAEGMMEIAKNHGETLRKFLEYLSKTYSGEPLLPLSAGACLICKKCSYPDEPCRFPDKMVAPMEGYGIFISDLCIKNNVKYNHGRGTLTYVGCFLFNSSN